MPPTAPPADEDSGRLHRFYLRDKNTAYLDNDLWLPRSISETPAILGGLVLDGGGEPIYLYRKTATHVVVPRHFPWTGSVVEMDHEYEKVAYEDGITLRTDKGRDQTASWAALSAAQFGILNLSCGFGKTVLMLKRIAQEGVPALIVSALTDTVQQWVEEIETYLGEKAGVVWQNKRQWDRNIVVASLGTLAANPDALPLDIRDRFGIIVYDEVHHYSAKTFKRVVNLFSGKRFGLTATVARADGTEAVYIYHVGPVIYSDLRQELKPRVYFQQLPTKVDVKKDGVTDVCGELNVPMLRTFVSTLEWRNRIVADHLLKAVENGRSILVLGHSVDGLAMLHEMLGPEVSALVVGKGAKGKKRLAKFRSGKVVLATLSIAAEALNAPHLDTLFYLTPVKTDRLTVQSIGRVLRQFAGKAAPMAVVFEDVNIHVLRSACKSMRRNFTAAGYSCEVIPCPTS